MFGTLLIANRGEIACRIARTARRLGVRSIALYTAADCDALHVAAADEARPVTDYLDIAATLAAARVAGAQAVHPGYGFLSENPDFAQACIDAGLAFVGPSPAAIRLLGDKAAARALAVEAGVPVIPGWQGDDGRPETVTAAAAELGFPVLIKPVAGGGGKGMKVVHQADDVAALLASARREAAAAFADDRVLLEKYVSPARHIEVQVFADSHGNRVTLGDRDCSLQRRHQKVVEEAPAPFLPAGIRSAMADAALAITGAADYCGAGTVEFLYDPAGDRFYFIEMNARLQVEHPVTELVFAPLDLVEWQLLVAAGEPLPHLTGGGQPFGAAVEVRLYAEDPVRDFLPSCGRIERLTLPYSLMPVRCDSGVRTGDVVGPDYDPLLAKIAVSGADRADAFATLRAVLGRVEVVGLATNLDLLLALAVDEALAAAAADTGFLERRLAELCPPPPPAPPQMVALATLGWLIDRGAAAREAAAAEPDPWSPWSRAGGWRLNHAYGETVLLCDNGHRATVEAVALPDGGWSLAVNGGAAMLCAGRIEGNGRAGSGTLAADIDGIRRSVAWTRNVDGIGLLSEGRNYYFELVDDRITGPDSEAVEDRILAPMPGRIVAVHVTAGTVVTAGTALVVLEAMKMEHTLKAPAAGRIATVRCTVGDRVDAGTDLVEFVADETPP